jgi:formylglycine-generating enzyme required for sulfatase activity
MEPTVRDALRQLIVRFDHALCDDPPRCEAALRDLCGQHKREISVLIRALKLRVATDLLATSAGLPVPMVLGRLRKRLEDEEAMTAEAAHWAVETWAMALGIVAEPVPMAAATAAPPRVQPPVAIDRPEPVRPGKGPIQASVPTPTPKRAAAPQPPPKPAQKTKPPSPPPAPVSAFRDRLKGGGEGPEMIRLTPGEFLMGAADGDTMASDSERPRHKVRIARPFAIGRFPVTFEEYDRFILATRHPPAAKRGLMGHLFGMKENKQRELPGDRGWGRSRRPVIYVSWHDAVAYCVWLSEQTGRTYCLPSEAEWEYACRAGTEARWSCGDDEKALGDHAWFSANSGGQTHPVGEKRPNPWGLHDMHGNVGEWVQDQLHRNYHGAPTDGSALKDATGASRVVRGGSWGSLAHGCRCAYRFGSAPAFRDGGLGFRCARVQES